MIADFGILPTPFMLVFLIFGGSQSQGTTRAFMDFLYVEPLGRWLLAGWGSQAMSRIHN